MASYSFYERHKNTYIKDLTNLGEELSGSQLAHDTTSIGLLNMRIIYNSASSDNLEYELGTEINSESKRGERIAGMSEDILDLAFFGTAEWKLSEQTVFRPGVRLFYNNKFGSKPIPSLAFKTGLNSFVFRASIAKAFRAPSLKELHLDFIDINHNIQGNSNLVAESGDHISGGIQFSHDEEKLSSLFELNGFYNRVINRIQLERHFVACSLHKKLENQSDCNFLCDHHLSCGALFPCSRTFCPRFFRGQGKERFDAKKGG